MDALQFVEREQYREPHEATETERFDLDE